MQAHCMHQINLVPWSKQHQTMRCRGPTWVCCTEKKRVHRIDPGDGTQVIRFSPLRFQRGFRATDLVQCLALDYKLLSHKKWLVCELVVGHSPDQSSAWFKVAPDKPCVIVFSEWDSNGQFLEWIVFILLHPEHGTSAAIQNNVLHILESKEEFKASGVIGIC